MPVCALALAHCCCRGNMCTFVDGIHACVYVHVCNGPSVVPKRSLFWKRRYATNNQVDNYTSAHVPPSSVEQI